MLEETVYFVFIEVQQETSGYDYFIVVIAAADCRLSLDKVISETISVRFMVHNFVVKRKQARKGRH